MRYYIRGSCILVIWSYGPHLVAHCGLSALMNFNEQVHKVIQYNFNARKSVRYSRVLVVSRTKCSV